MKANIHPEYGETTMTCACGAVYHTRSTKNRLRLGICSSCHPLFTGQQKLIDTAGRVEKFMRRFGNKMPDMSAAAAKTVKTARK